MRILYKYKESIYDHNRSKIPTCLTPYPFDPLKGFECINHPMSTLSVKNVQIEGRLGHVPPPTIIFKTKKN